MGKMIYIYMIVNTINKKVYIGSSNNISRRFTKHKYQLNKSIHPNEHLQNAWNKYGSDSFKFRILAVCPNNERNNCEQMFMDLYNAQNRNYGYNIKNADGHSQSEETKLKLSEINKGKVVSEKTKKKLSNLNSGKNNHNYGKNLSDETKKKMSESKIAENNPNWKKYARIVKGGSYKYKGKDKQQYVIKFNGEVYKTSFSINKLIKWFADNYPGEELVIND